MKGYHARMLVIAFGLFTIVSVVFGNLFGQGCGMLSIFSANPGILSIEEHCRLNEAGTKENPPEVRDTWNRETKLIVDKIQPIPEETIVDIGEIFPYFKDNGAEKTLKKFKNKEVRFPNWADAVLSMKKAIPTMKRYKEDGIDLSNDRIVDTGFLGANHMPVFLPKHFWDMLQEAASEAGLTWVNYKPPKDMGRKEVAIAYGIRDYNLQAVMFVRSVKSACGEYPSKASQSCMREVGIHTAGKPSKKSLTHLPSADINEWRKMKAQLLKRGFAVGCSGIDGEKDARHTTWGVDQHEASLKCSISEWWTTF
jgi:hypothetical protein